MERREREETAQYPALWRSLAERFPGDLDCLASFMAYEAAEVLEGVKPANLVNLVNRDHPCGKNLYRLWREHGAGLAESCGLRTREMIDRGDSLLLMIYGEEALAGRLEDGTVRAVLRRAGYAEDADGETLMAEMGKRLREGPFPHEIGLVLGYPVKDVLGFMGWSRRPFSCQGQWKIYGCPHESLELAETFRECRCRMARRLACHDRPLEAVRRGG